VVYGWGTCGSSLAAIVGSNLARGMESVVNVVLSGRSLCDELITRLEKSYRVWCVVESESESLSQHS
jgi:hypothetical protein